MVNRLGLVERAWKIGLLLTPMSLLGASGLASHADPVVYDFSGSMILARATNGMRVGIPISGIFCDHAPSPKAGLPFSALVAAGDRLTHHRVGTSLRCDKSTSSRATVGQQRLR